MPLLYYWKREQFLADNQTPLTDAPLNLSQDAPALADAAGHRMWVFTRDCDDVYILVASLFVERVERSGSAMGAFTAFDRVGSTVKYRLLNPVVDVEPTIRKLGLSVAAPVLGSNFQGTSAVRLLSDEDDRVLEEFASHLKRASLGFRWKPASCK